MTDWYRVTDYRVDTFAGCVNTCLVVYGMEFPDFSAIKAPSIACWALMLAVAYGGILTSNDWLLILSLILLIYGISLYEKEGIRREEKERLEKDEKNREKRDKDDKDFLTGLWDFGSKYIPKP